ncbi:SDR family NAD(P)-dependent oxidoreductase [Streptomyces sp. NEAU-YJ-81]|uniref:SDR family NAD(P)-dependent oxidoreductase n=1 Tax=Streptomyces sp. NEAU-YJ-81 TaxID=2820288 RepID=UPI001FBB57EC|nr:SDR family oxidoreductase [Streptomyces sp. NEAU-YJ-81]
MRMQDRVAIVTGAGGGLGKAQVSLLASQGAHVIATDIDGHCGDELTDSSSADGGDVVFHQADVTVPGDWDRLIGTVMERHGRIDALVNNAGLSGLTFPDHDDLDGWNTLMSVNATSVYLGTTKVGKRMAAAKRGSIVNISSIVGIVGGTGGHPGYYASKGAVRTFTKMAALRLGRDNVRVNSVHPGYMPAMRGGSTSASERGSGTESIPLGRLGEPREIAYGVLFLACDESSYMTGSELVIDGGFLAR